MSERVLITGGAGFIGSHLADELLLSGYEVRVLDSLSPQVHGPEQRRPEYLDPEVELQVDAVVHLAAMVGVGQSMYEIARYTQRQRRRHGGPARGADPAPGAPLVVASSMSVYGEGLYRDRQGRLHAGRRALARAAARRALGSRRRRRRAARERAHPRGRAGQPDVGLRPLEVRPGAAVPHDRARLRHPHGRAALLQRLRPAPGALQPVHRRAGDLRGAPPERQAAADLRGREQQRDFVSRARRRARLPRWRSRPTAPVDGVFNVGSGASVTIREVASAWRASSARTSSPRSPASTASATSATASPTSAAGEYERVERMLETLQAWRSHGSALRSRGRTGTPARPRRGIAGCCRRSPPKSKCCPVSSIPRRRWGSSLRLRPAA
jgi:dTDP-L-rhamnose 4-epimerase